MAGNSDANPAVGPASSPHPSVVGTTIVGGRPTVGPAAARSAVTSGVGPGDIPRGLEVLIKKASVDAAFRAVLLARRSAAADEIWLTLQPAEAAMLDTVPAGQLEAIIARTPVEPGKAPAFLGKAAVVMLAALGASSVAIDAQDGQISRGVRPINPPAATAPVEPGNAGTAATTRPADTQASQPASQEVVSRELILSILKQMDSDEYAQRQAAQNHLQGLGLEALPILREILKPAPVGEKLSGEVVGRIKAAMMKIKATTRPALLNPPEPDRDWPEISIGMRARRTPPPPVEKPED